MATWFVDGSVGLNTNAGTSWSAPFQTVTQALSVASSGDIIACGSTGSYTAGAAITWTLPAGTISIISATNVGSGTVVTPAAGASELAGATTGGFSIVAGAGSSANIFGISGSAGSTPSGSAIVTFGASATAYGLIELDSCTFDLPQPNAAGCIVFGGTAAIGACSLLTIAKNCAWKCSGSRAGTYFYFKNGNAIIINPTFAFTGASVPQILMSTDTVREIGSVTIKDADLSFFASGSYISLSNNGGVQFDLQNIKLNATPTLTTGSWLRGNGSITLRNVASGGTFSVFEYLNPYGALISNTSIYRNSGAQFNAAGISWQIVTTALCSPQSPFYTPPIGIWGATVTAETATVEIDFDATSPNPTTPLTDLQIWPSIDFNGNASFPLGTYQDGRNASPIVGTGAAWNASAQVWTGTSGFTTETKQTLNPAGNGNTITPAVAGLLNMQIGVAVPNATIYVDPQVNGVT